MAGTRDRRGHGARRCRWLCKSSQNRIEGTRSQRGQLTDVVKVDRTVAAAGTVVAEIATLRQKLAAAALEQFTSWTSDKAKGVMSRAKTIC